MSLARKQALISGLAWLAISITFAVIITNIGVDSFAGPDGERARDLIATVIVPGYLINFAIIWRSRRGRRAGEIDERDKVVERRATEFTALITLLTIFLVSIRIYDVHVDEGMVPVGWFFVMAYGTIALVSLLHPVFTLILDVTGRTDA